MPGVLLPWSTMGLLSRSAVALIGALAGCSPGAFTCEDAAQCPGGTCEAVGYCSFPDDACPSRQRFGAHAPTALAHQCVEPSGDETSTSLGLTSDASSSAGSVTDASLTGVATTMATTQGPGTMTTDGTASASSSGGDTGVGTTAELPPDAGVPLSCAIEDFADDSFDPWSTWTSGADLSVLDDHLVIVLHDGVTNAAGFARDVPAFDEAIFEAQWLEVPAFTNGTQIYLRVAQTELGVLMMLEDGNLKVRNYVGEANEDVFVVPWEEWQTWWRVVASGGEMSFQVSADGDAYTEVYAEPLVFAPGDVGIAVIVATWQPVDMPGQGVLEQLAVCM